MIKNVVTDIGGVGLYGIISVCLFFTVFTGAFVWALLKKRSFLNYMGALPLADEPKPASNPEGDSSHE